MRIRTLAIVMVCALLPAFALAEAPSERQGGMQAASQMGRYNVDRTQLTDEQKQVYDTALSDYAAVEDRALADLVAAGDITQDASDRFTQIRDQQGAMASLEMDSWSGEQRQAFQDAMAATGDDRTAALAALASSGLLTQQQADAFSNRSGFMSRRADARQDGQLPADGQLPPDGGQFTRDGNPPDGDRQGGAERQGGFDIWQQIQSQEQTASVQAALTTIQAAQQAFSEALLGAGIQMGS